MMEIPEFLYKYMFVNPEIKKLDPDYYKNLFIKKEIYFPTLKELNDPYDCHPSFSIDNCSDEYLNRVFLKRNRKNFSRHAFRRLESTVNHDKQYARRVMSENIKHFERNGMKNRVLSLSATPTSTAMWAHYSNNYKGFCLKFSTRCFGNYKDVFRRIVYSKLRPILTPQDLENPESPVVPDSAFIKSEEWAYEQEWRVFTSVKLFPNNKIGFPDGFLCGMIFGINMQPDEKELILRWVSESTYKNIEINKISLCPKSFDLIVIKN